MTRPPVTTRPDATGSIAAILGGMLGALLAALLGVARLGAMGGARPVDAELSGVMAAVLRAEADAEMTGESWIEWVAVPAPWRNGRLLPRRHEARRVRSRGVRPAARMRGPPVRCSAIRDARTGMA
ncbi:MAG: hypothetical protein NT133_23490 [Alphaproteobacteria bacterium]|nr:hypothetical protein [Alphaproteobacteria bacterium]